ncbi:MAG: hypothetical protein HXY28_05445 [Hydrogenophilaceae bacterium]|nr:hypothetical protein [Hydrogenophilaceae bacterium]
MRFAGYLDLGSVDAVCEVIYRNASRAITECLRDYTIEWVCVPIEQLQRAEQAYARQVPEQKLKEDDPESRRGGNYRECKQCQNAVAKQRARRLARVGNLDDQ